MFIKMLATIKIIFDDSIRGTLSWSFLLFPLKIKPNPYKLKVKFIKMDLTLFGGDFRYHLKFHFSKDKWFNLKFNMENWVI